MPNEGLTTTTQEVDILAGNSRELILRLHTPPGAGPFPVVLDLHGGAWCKGHIDDCDLRDKTLANAGIAAGALDFRHGPDGYPTSNQDINYAVRWVKANAANLNLDPARVGIVGQSSGGHLAMLAGMRPADPRYLEILLEGVDATVKAVVMVWPVINPLSRYRHAHRERLTGNPAAWVGDIPERHDLYWVTEDNMTDGNPMLALENGEMVEMPPALWIQGSPDPVHDYRDLDSGADLNEPNRFVRNYKKAGGEIEMFRFEKATQTEMTAIEPTVAFFQKHL